VALIAGAAARSVAAAVQNVAVEVLSVVVAQNAEQVPIWEAMARTVAALHEPESFRRFQDVLLFWGFRVGLGDLFAPDDHSSPGFVQAGPNDPLERRLLSREIYARAAPSLLELGERLAVELFVSVAHDAIPDPHFARHLYGRFLFARLCRAPDAQVA
jgi:hypothetical protein